MPQEMYSERGTFLLSKSLVKISGITLFEYL